jgi:hypothetical protein
VNRAASRCPRICVDKIRDQKPRGAATDSIESVGADGGLLGRPIAMIGAGRIARAGGSRLVYFPRCRSGGGFEFG